MKAKQHRPIVTYFILITLLNISFLSYSQEQNNTTYFGENSFILEGTLVNDSLKENRYDRLPFSYKGLVREPVWNLSKSSAGMSIRFFTNSTSIRVKWTLLNNNKMNHMAETGIKGVDLYFKNEGKWQYLNTARPSGLENEFTLINNMTSEMREFKMYLPLYDGIKTIEIGIDSDKKIRKPVKSNQKSIIFYGTSITQGGCASRPGMAHTNIISRKLNIDCINFGFSGNGMMEQPISELISGFNPLFYVIECLPNMSIDQVTERTIPLVKTIREKHSETPIIFVENFRYPPSALDTQKKALVNEKNTALKNEYTKMINKGYSNIFYISSKDATGEDYEGTVDGLHFTDLGFTRYADFLIDKFVQLGLINEKSD